MEVRLVMELAVETSGPKDMIPLCFIFIEMMLLGPPQ